MCGSHQIIICYHHSHLLCRLFNSHQRLNFLTICFPPFHLQLCPPSERELLLLKFAAFLFITTFQEEDSQPVETDKNC